MVAVLGVAVACGGNSKGDDDSGGGSGGTTGGTKSTGGSGNTTSSGGSGNTTSSGGSGNTTSSGGSGAKGGTSSGSGGTTSTGGSGGSGGTGDPITITQGNCPSFTACGGDVVGSWKLTSVCGPAMPMTGTGGSTMDMPSCATIANETATSDVDYEFKSDGTFAAAGTVTITADESLDDACAMSTYGADAATTCGLLNSFGDQGGTDFQLSCTAANGVCDCLFTIPTTTNETGTYTVDGDQVTTNYTDTASDGTTSSGSETDSFCVKGSTLTEQADDGSLGTLTRN